MCDRRLSRAARAILQEKLLASPQGKKLEEKPADFWQLLELFVGHSEYDGASNTTTTCPLWPSHDLLRADELHSAVIPADPKRIPRQRRTGFTTARFAHVYSHGHNPYWYQCLYCHKTFSTRYYLDRHMANQHATTIHNNDNNTHICPATDWCPFLSPTACHDRALQDEPYYDKGSGGRRNDRYKVEARLWKQAHAVPCTAAAATAATITCRAVGDACFRHHDTAAYWKNVVCRRLSCPSRLQHLYFRSQQDGDLILQQLHQWQDEWSDWYEEHPNVGWAGSGTLLLLLLYYARLGYRQWVRYRRRTRAGPRLLRPKAKRH